MFRALMRMASVVFLAAALISGVLDLTRSIADSTLVLTPFSADWARYFPASMEAARRVVMENLHPLVWDPVLITLMSAPSWAVFCALWLIFAVAGRTRRRRWQENFGA